MLAEVDYLLLLDKLYILSSGFVVLTLAVIVRNSWVDATGDVARAARADRRAWRCSRPAPSGRRR
jgi:hypothetical protein